MVLGITDTAMHISLSRDEFRELLQLIYLGAYVRNTVFESEGVYDPENDNGLMDELCALAHEEGIEDVEEDFDGDVVFTSLFIMMCVTLMETFEQERFWEQLESRTRVRDLEREPVCECT